MTQHALFVGNSYTFYNDVPGQVGALCVEAGHELETEWVAEGGANVQLHWEPEGTGARKRIEEGGYDVLVLQDQSGGPLHDRKRFETYAPRLAEAALATGARLIWYQTWARAEGHEAYSKRWSGGTRREMTTRVRDAYREMAARVGGEVAPVGDAWLVALESDSTLVLHDEDLHHAAPLGSHLAALVLAATVAAISPLSARYLPAGVDEAAAARLRDVAHRVVVSET